MSEQLIWFTGNRNPSITETITVNTVAVDLTSSTVRFKMRAVGSATLKVDQPATVVSATAGTVRYDWAAVDVDTAGQYLIWWEVTTGGKAQDMNEALIEFRAHSNANVYVELEQFKSTAELTGHHFADQDIRLALVAASRAIDNDTGRRFYPDTDANQIRYYTPTSHNELWVDDLITLTALVTAPSADGLFTDTWVSGTDFQLEPHNALLESRPYQTVRSLPSSSRYFPAYARSVKVTGKFGWATAPQEIQLATIIIATQLFKRAREAPFGVIGGFEDAVRISRFDSQVQMLVQPFKRGWAL